MGRNVMSEFFEYKYLTMENYYKYICDEGYNHTQAAGRCLVDYTIVLSEDSVKSIAIYSTLLVQLCKYAEETISFKHEYGRLVHLCEILELEDILSEKERSYLTDDMEFIKYKFNNRTEDNINPTKPLERNINGL